MDSFSNLCHSLMGLKDRHKHIYTATETVLGTPPV